MVCRKKIQSLYQRREIFYGSLRSPFLNSRYLFSSLVDQSREIKKRLASLAYSLAKYVFYGQNEKKILQSEKRRRRHFKFLMRENFAFCYKWWFCYFTQSGLNINYWCNEIKNLLWFEQWGPNGTIYETDFIISIFLLVKVMIIFIIT